MSFGNMQQLMKQAKKMQDDMAKKQAELDKYETEYQVGGGAISLKINGKLEISDLSIDEDLLEDKEELEDLLLTAINGAVKKAQSHVDQEMGSVTGGMNIPGF